jgi:hypothetical protein
MTPDWYNGIIDLIFLVGVLAFFGGILFVGIRGFWRGFRK